MIGAGAARVAKGGLCPCNSWQLPARTETATRRFAASTRPRPCTVRQTPGPPPRIKEIWWSGERSRPSCLVSR